MIHCNNIHKSYNDKQVLQGVDFSVKPGCIYTLIGKNGSGKSTLINLISGLLPVSSGSIEILDSKVGTANRAVLRNVGFVFEESILIEKFTAREQLEFTANLYSVNNPSAETDRILELLGLPDNTNAYIENYSSGMRSKLSIGCALIHSPKILLMDEPFTGLDIPSLSKMFSFVREYVNNDRVAIITTHQIEAISALSDFVMLLRDGRISWVLSYDELKREASSEFVESRAPVRDYLYKFLV